MLVLKEQSLYKAVTKSLTGGRKPSVNTVSAVDCVCVTEQMNLIYIYIYIIITLRAKVVMLVSVFIPEIVCGTVQHIT